MPFAPKQSNWQRQPQEIREAFLEGLQYSSGCASKGYTANSTDKETCYRPASTVKTRYSATWEQEIMVTEWKWR
ncbi:hypothetical protein BH20ACI3_BH20ACI3_41820 [soil metagenome]